MTSINRYGNVEEKEFYDDRTEMNRSGGDVCLQIFHHFKKHINIMDSN